MRETILTIDVTVTDGEVVVNIFDEDVFKTATFDSILDTTRFITTEVINFIAMDKDGSLHKYGRKLVLKDIKTCINKILDKEFTKNESKE